MAKLGNKDPRMMEVAVKLKQFLEENNAFITYNNLTEKIYLSDRTRTENLGWPIEIDQFDISEEMWQSDDN